jgi:eukaryotic-like serine/threonine-protein kinase
MPEGSDSNPSIVCPECGTSLADGGVCARCLLGGVLEDSIHPQRRVARAPAPAGARTLGDYELIEEVAHGGMGVVWRARDRRSKRTVALKLIRGGNLPGEASTKRFKREAQLTADIRHPNIVAIHEIGEQDEQLFLAMDLVRGGSLADRIDQGPVPPREAAAVVAKVARAIHFAHMRGILHRDLKPANILIGADGEPQVCDFGLARAIEEESNLTLTGELLGTPAYMAPEVAAGAKGVTTACDTYSLGAILYELIAGGPAFTAGTLPSLLRKITDDDPVRPENHADGSPVPYDLATIALKCMEKRPDARYASALDLAEDLDRWLLGEAIHAQSVGTIIRVIKWARRKPLLASLWAVIAVLLLVVAVGSTILSVRLAREKNAATELAVRARRQIARQLSESAQRFISEGDGLRALPSLAEAISIGTGDARLDEANRIRYGVIVRTSPVLRNAWLNGEEILRAACTRDGQRMMLASESGIEIWNPLTATRLAQLPRATVTAMFDSGAGRWVAFEDSGGDCFVWKPDSGTVHPAGSRLLSPMGDGFMHTAGIFAVRAGRTVEVRAAEDGGLRHGPFEHPAEVSWAFVLGDLGRVLAADADGTLHGWDLATGRAAFTPVELGGGRSITLDDFDPATGKVILHRARQCWLFDTKEGRVVHHRATFEDLPQTFAWADGRALFLSRMESGVTLHDVEGDGAMWISRLGAIGFRGSFAPVVNKVATQSWNGAARVLGLKNGRSLTPLIWQPATPAGCLLDPAGRWFLARGDEPAARLWTLREDGGAMQAAAAATSAVALWYAGSPERLHIADEEGVVTAWASGQALRKTSEFKHPGALRWAGPVGGGNTFTAGVKSARFWSADGAPFGKPFESEKPIIHAASNPAARVIAVALEGGDVVVWDPVAGRAIAQFAGEARTVELAADGRRVLVVSPVCACVWDVQTGKPLSPSVTEPRGEVIARLSPDGGRVVQWSTAGAPGQHSARVWDSATGKVVATLAPHWLGVNAAAWSPDGTQIATGGDDHTARICDAATGKAIVPALRQVQQINDLGFSADGLLLWTRAARNVIVWDTASGEPVTAPYFTSATKCFVAMNSGRLLTLDSDKHLPSTYDLSADPRPAEELAAVARALSSHKLIPGTTVLAPLSIEESRAVWEVAAPRPAAQ